MRSQKKKKRDKAEPEMFILPGKSGIHRPRLSSLKIKLIRLEKNVLKVFLHIEIKDQAKNRLLMSLVYLKDLWIASLCWLIFISTTNRIARGCLFCLLAVVHCFSGAFELKIKQDFYEK